ncbi:NADPH-dependent cytochrome P450 oxidoreductase [Phycomyces nitens]|nr:NADPH-dependent cytochrome P450 oxidoreductase [Phycomyces nitens]
MSQQQTAMIDSLDIAILGAIGLGTAAWFGRKKIAEKFFKPAPPPPAPAAQTPKQERNFVKIMQEQGRRVIFFYGSQTGTAEDYAGRLAKECSQKYGVSCMTADIELYDLSYLDSVSSDMLVFFIMATYGEGEPTDNAVEFWDFVTEEEPEFSELSGSGSLSNLRYILFGLGNRTYEQYNEVCRVLDKKLINLGAKRIGERGEGDDDGSLEEDFLTWQETMWPAFCEALGVDEHSARSGPREATYRVDELDTAENVYLGELAEKSDKSKIVYDSKHPYLAPAETRVVFDEEDRHCLHIEFDITDSNLVYHTGDHLALWPSNNEIEVGRLANVLGISHKLDKVVNVCAVDKTAAKKSPFPVPTTYRTILRHYLDICAPVSRQTLMALVEFAPEEIKARLHQLATDKDAYRLEVGEAVRNLGEVIELASGTTDSKDILAAVPFDLIIESISRLQPRYYSISSSSKETPKKISATVVTLAYQPETTPGRTVYGVATHFLYNVHTSSHNQELKAGYPAYDVNGPHNAYKEPSLRLPVHVRRSTFKLPRNPACPVIMIGPGTGVAPFRGFVRERAFHKTAGKPIGPTLLFFGSRTQKDFLYADEWPELFETLGEGSRLITAFSRETAKKVYVQHRLQEAGEEVWELISKGAYLYVCGDAKSMARDVHQTFVNLAITYGGKSEEKANEFIKTLRSTGRYQEDVWS